MGWFPVRESDNTVKPENLFFNQPQAIQRAQQGGSNIIRGRRAHESAKGTRKHPHGSVGQPPRIRKADAWRKRLTHNAMLLGWLNGRKVKKGK